MLQSENSEYKELEAVVIDYVDVKLGKIEEDQDDKLVPEPLINLNQNNKKSLFTLKINELNKDNIPTACTTYMTKDEPNNSNTINKSEAFLVPLFFIINFFRQIFNLELEIFNFEQFFAENISNFKKILEAKIYQILCYSSQNFLKIKKLLQKFKNIREKKIFYYFMTRTYEEIYNIYIIGDINFPLINNGTVRICNFITLEKEIKGRKEKLKEFEDISRNMIKDIKGIIDKNEMTKSNIFAFEIELFEKMRNHFKEKMISTAMEVEN